MIFDFDGTLCDSLGLSIRLVNARARRYKYRVVQPGDVDTLRSLNLRQAIRFLHLHPFRLPLVIRQLRHDFGHALGELHLVPGMLEAVIDLRQAGFSVGILSSNSLRNIQAFLRDRQLLQHFDFIQAGSSLRGKSRLLKKVMNQRNFKPHEVVYVGDEARDIEACRLAGVAVVSVSWGFNSREMLAARSPDHLVDHPEEFRELRQFRAPD